MDFSEERFYRASHIFLDEVPALLRRLYKDKWDLKYPQHPWDNTPVSGQNFLSRERNKKTKDIVKNGMLHGDRSSWDGTILFAALLYSSHQLIARATPEYDLIDNLRKIRNVCFAHRAAAKIPEAEYINLIREVKAIFNGFGWPHTGIEDIEEKQLHTSDNQALQRSLSLECERNDSLGIRVDSLEIKNNFLETRLESIEERGDSLDGTVKLVTEKNDLFGVLLESFSEKSNLIETRVKSVESNSLVLQGKLELFEQKRTSFETQLESYREINDSTSSRVQFVENENVLLCEKVEYVTKTLGVRVQSCEARIEDIEKGK